jgi:hypothetical protein
MADHPFIYNAKHIRLRDRIMARLFGKLYTAYDPATGCNVIGRMYKGNVYILKITYTP